MYAGLGGRYSERSFKGESHKKFNEYIYDYGYTGNVLFSGIRIGFCIEGVIGYQKEITSRLYLDVYVGFGLRYSFHDTPEGTDIKFNNNIFDYGYTGTAFVGGFRFGVGL